jgi:hypothetical protein
MLIQFEELIRGGIIRKPEDLSLVARAIRGNRQAVCGTVNSDRFVATNKQPGHAR